MAEWYYRLDEAVQGPVNEDDLKHIFDSGALPLTTPIWCEGMKDWVEAKTLELLTGTSVQDSPDKHKNQPPCIALSTTEAKGARIPTKWAVSALAVVCLMFLVVFGYSAIHNKHSQQGRVVAAAESSLPFNKASRQPERASVGRTKGEEYSPLNGSTQLQEPKQASVKEPHEAELNEPAKSGSNDNTNHTEILDKWLSHMSFDNYLFNVKTAITNEQQTHTFSDEYATATILIKNVLEHPAGSLDEFPEPIIGSHDKVFELIEYVQDKLKGVRGQSQMILASHKELQCWVVHDGVGGYAFVPSDLDPSSGQIVSKPELDMFNHSLTGRTHYFVKFKSRNSKERIILYSPNVFGIPGVSTQRELEISCGFGPGDQEAERIAKGIAALILAYGGKEEIIN
jgi:hypothetical protein